MFTLKENAYSLKYSDNKLTVPQPHTQCLKVKHSFSYNGALLWNVYLGLFLRSMVSLSSFKKGLDAFCIDIKDL